MPGHMNVLLAEANVPYDQLEEMDEANPEMPTTDVALVVGANDTVNPAAKTTPGSPIYGMPIINADEAENIVFLKRSMRPGFAGIDNELLYDPKTTMLFGDAKDTLQKLVAAVGRRLRSAPECSWFSRGVCGPSWVAAGLEGPSDRKSPFPKTDG